MLISEETLDVECRCHGGPFMIDGDGGENKGVRAVWEGADASCARLYGSTEHMRGNKRLVA